MFRSKKEKTLSLKDFVRNTLIEVNTAVIEAAESGVEISHKQYGTGVHPEVKTVEFDIALQILKNNNTEKGGNLEASISVLNLDLGYNKKTNRSEMTTNRIKFSVDVFLGMKDDKNVGEWFSL